MAGMRIGRSWLRHSVAGMRIRAPRLAPASWRQWLPCPPWPMSAIVSSGRGSTRRHRRREAVAHGQRAARVAGAIHRLREDRERVLPGRLDDRRRGLGDGDAELVDRDRMHVLAVGGDDRHLQAGNAHVEVRHRRSVDEPQPDALARREQPGPVAGRRLAVHQVGVGAPATSARSVAVHPHLAPRRALGERRRRARCAARRAGNRRPCAGGSCSSPTASSASRTRAPGLSSVQSVSITTCSRSYANGSGLARLDDERAVEAALLLEAGVAVVPVGAALPHAEAIRVGLARVDAVEAQAGHAVHVGRQQDAVPVDRRVFTRARSTRAASPCRLRASAASAPAASR